MNFSGWAGLDAPARQVFLDQLLERLPPWLELVEAAPQPRFRDTRFNEGWRLFEGGPVTLGLTAERAEAIEGFRRRDPMALFDPTVYLPPREVRVAPFLLMEQPLLTGEESRVFVGPAAKRKGESTQGAMREELAMLAARGQRLPSEAEWEFAWWAVQTQRAHWRPSAHELCADGWRPHLREPVAVDGRVPGGPEVLRSASFEGRALESVFPTRQPLSLIRLFCIRPALDLPGLEGRY